jgi:hypothetical protein
LNKYTNEKLQSKNIFSLKEKARLFQNLNNNFSKSYKRFEKFFFRKMLSDYEWKAIKTIAYTPGEAANVLFSELKKAILDKKPNYKYNPNIDWEWEIITPERTYKSNETSS